MSNRPRDPAPAPYHVIRFGDPALRLILGVDEDGSVHLADLAAASHLSDPDDRRTPVSVSARTALPLVELGVAGAGRRGTPGPRLLDTATGRVLRHRRHVVEEPDDTSPLRRLRVDLAAPGIDVSWHAEQRPGLSALRCRTTVRNTGSRPLTLEHVSSLVHGLLAPHGSALNRTWHSDSRVAVSVVRNGWCGELRALRRSLPQAGIDRLGERSTSKTRLHLAGTGSWSCCEHLPMGCWHAPDVALLFQIEHNGPWGWEIGDYDGGLYLLAGGPDDRSHQWRRRLAPGEVFDSVPVTVAVAHGADADARALTVLTEQRRSTRRPLADHALTSIVFNDYMNCLDGDPTTARLLPLIDAAADAGCEVFVIDAGWYAEDETWWETVGDWKPAAWRFPTGLEEVLDRIRDRGMTPGLWLEPEVIGIHSPAASVLPEQAFFHRGGERVVDSGRHQLDFRHPAVTRRLDAVVDRIVGEWKVGYLKLDYNIDSGTGTETAADSPGSGQLDHNRAYLSWLDRVLDRHPGLVVENCASGGMRMDWAQASRHASQSLTDQPDPLRLPPIAASAPLAVPPEQAAVWACPQPEFDAEELAFTMVSALLGRIHLSGRLADLTSDQAGRVRRALDAYKTYRHLLPASSPLHPLGLPGWDDAWLAAGLLLQDGSALVAAWRRPTGETSEDALPQSRDLPVAPLAGIAADTRVLYPADLPADARWDTESGRLSVTLPRAPAARLFHLRAPTTPASVDEG